MPSAFVDDGHTLSDTIESPEELFDPFRIEYRRALPAAIREHAGKTFAADGKSGHKADADYLAKYLVSWTLKDGKGETVQLTAANIARLDLSAMHRIAAFINGYTPHQEAEETKNSSGA